ncbi:MAG TPA: PxKF domain-containing protein [Blastococcus sp.]|nr:PxKF domain-containing protein [Blastococcus sp.]
MIAAGTAMALTFSGVALADNIQDNIQDDISSAITLVAGSTTGGTAKIRVVGNNSQQDPDAGCNFDSTPEYLDIAINAPVGVTATPATLHFTTCGDDQTVTFTASGNAAAGTGNATAAIIKNGTDGTFQNSVSIPITVTRPNTPPTVTVTGVTASSYVIGNEPTPGCSVSDAEEPSLSATPNVDRSGVVSGLGQVTVSCSVTDAGGLSDSNSVSYTIVPPPNTKPSVSVTGVTNGQSYEIGSEPTVGCAVTDAEDVNPTASPVITGTLSHGLGSQTATCDYTDLGGLAADTASVTYSIVDTGAPTITGSVSPASPNGLNGWYNTAPTVSFVCADAGSQIQSCLADGQSSNSVTLSDGLDQSVSGTATDWAGLTATDTVAHLSVDTTPPAKPSFVGAPASSFRFTGVPVTLPSCTSTDGLSGLLDCTVSGDTGAAVGSHTLTATATDRAGNTAKDTFTYTVLPLAVSGFYQPVDMGGTPNSAKAGSTIPVKFEIFGATELTDVSAVQSIKYRSVSCASLSGAADEIESLASATGGTALRYDLTAGQFVYNWKTPAAGCYQLTMLSADGVTQASAFFNLRK